MFRNCIAGSSLKNYFMYDFPRFATYFIVQIEKHTKTGLISLLDMDTTQASYLLIIGTFI